MAANHPEAYWRAVAMGIDAENQKASVYIKHSEIGAAREAILRRVIITETPGPFEVKTGFIRGKQPGPEGPDILSGQCDLLVYDPHNAPPLYRIEDLVVIPPSAARLAIEVKSYLGNKKFDEALRTWVSVRGFRKPTLVYAFNGATFGTFLAYMAKYVQGNPYNLPECFGVHAKDKNYIAFRGHDLEGRRPRVRRYFALNFGPEAPGAATALFMKLYDSWLKNDGYADVTIVEQFNGCPLPSERKVWIDPTGGVHPGNCADVYPDEPSAASVPPDGS